MVEIIPAVIPKDFYELTDRVADVAGHVKTIHLDVCDGIFVKNTSWPWNGDKVFEDIKNGDRGLPEWEDIDYEVHLMTAHPEKDVFDWILGGAYKVIVQLESFFPHNKKDFDDKGKARFDAMLEKLKKDHLYNPENEDDFYQIGLGVEVDTPLEVVIPLIEKFNFIHLMSIPRIGFQGVEFDEKIYDRIAEIKKYNKKISVDGGINLENAKKVVDVGADSLVIGSAIFSSDVPSAAVEDFHNLFD